MSLPRDLLNEILQYALPDKYVLDGWVNTDKLDWYNLSSNNKACDVLKEFPDTIIWDEISFNRGIGILIDDYFKEIHFDELLPQPWALDIIERYLHRIPKEDLFAISLNPAAIEILKANPDIIDWEHIIENPNAKEILNANRDKIDWMSNTYNARNTIRKLCKNPAAIDIIKEIMQKSPDKINWEALSSNPAAIDIIKVALIKAPHKINWSQLSSNPAAIDILKAASIKAPHKINWANLTTNSAAIDILKANPDKVCWGLLIEPTHIEEWAKDLVIANFDIIKHKSIMSHPEVIDCIKKVLHENPESISWYELSYNSAAIDILKANPDKINWSNIAANEGIFRNAKSDIIDEILDIIYLQYEPIYDYDGHISKKRRL